VGRRKNLGLEPKSLGLAAKSLTYRTPTKAFGEF
jgi:hypothetical protein